MDIFFNMLHFINIILLFMVGICYSEEYKCGFPGSPKYGSVTPNEAAYKEGEQVVYSCRIGHILLGSTINRCKSDGTWSEDVPICDDSMTTLVLAFSTATLPGYPAEYAIDKNKERCTYLQPKSHSWWRIDFEEEYTVLSVAVTMVNTDKHVKFTVSVVQAINGVASYKRCASFNGKFGTPTMLLLCAEGKGIKGSKVHIEVDEKPSKEIFEICEVEVQVKKDDASIMCGFPSRSLYLEVKEQSDYRVEYDCLKGYRLSGKEYRKCNTKLGKWSGEPPVCIPIVCDDLEPFENGVYQIEDGTDGPALEGSMVVYSCNSGYRLIGKSHRICDSDGSWPGRPPKCRIITCPSEIPYDVGGKWRYQSNGVGSYATLRCTNEKYEGDDLTIKCLEDGVWSEPDARCLVPIPLAKKEGKPRIVNQGGVIFGMVLAAIMIVIAIVGVYLYDQRRRNNKPELPSRFQEPPLPPPRPPPRTKENAFRSAFKGILNRDNQNSERSDLSSWKTQSLPSQQSYTGDTEPNLNSKKALSYGESLPSGEDVVEVEVLPPHRPGRKGVITPVPEEPENAAVDDVVIEMDETDSKKDSSTKDSKNASDYAAVDYEKKRQSRLLKEQDSLESSSTAPGSPLPLDESDNKELSRTSTPAKNLEESEEEEDEEEEEEEDSGESQHTESQKKREAEAKEEQERKAKEEEERKAKEEAERKAKEEEQKKRKEEAGSRRRRARDDPPPPEVEEEKPVLRRLRRFQ